MKEYTVECEECENTSIVGAYENVKFCPICGRRAEVEQTSYDVEELNFDDGD